MTAYKCQFGLATLLLATACLAILGAAGKWHGLIGIDVLLLAVCVAAVVYGILRRKWRAVAFGSIAAALLALAYPLIQADQRRRAWANRELDAYDLYQIGNALRGYYAEHGHFPPAFIADENGKPMHSWRVLILPYLGYDNLYKAYDFSEPWDGPNNSRLIQSMPAEYSWRTNRQRNPTMTGFVVVTGDNTVFPGTVSRRIQEVIPAGTDRTILAVPYADSGIVWTEPRDLCLDNMSYQIDDRTQPSIRSFLSDGVPVLMVNTGLDFLPQSCSPAFVRSLLTIDAEEVTEAEAFEYWTRSDRKDVPPTRGLGQGH